MVAALAGSRLNAARSPCRNVTRYVVTAGLVCSGSACTESTTSVAWTSAGPAPCATVSMVPGTRVPGARMPFCPSTVEMMRSVCVPAGASASRMVRVPLAPTAVARSWLSRSRSPLTASTCTRGSAASSHTQSPGRNCAASAALCSWTSRTAVTAYVLVGWYRLVLAFCSTLAATTSTCSGVAGAPGSRARTASILAWPRFCKVSEAYLPLLARTT